MQTYNISVRISRANNRGTGLGSRPSGNYEWKTVAVDARDFREACRRARRIALAS